MRGVIPCVLLWTLASACQLSSPAQDWQGSAHDLAQQPASADTVLADFDGVSVAVSGSLVATPLRQRDAFQILIQDEAGELELDVVEVIGLEPLQQYLLDGGKGRLLVAPIAWDVAAERWFDPSEGVISGDPSDELYWAGMSGNWNHQCASCHQTGSSKGFEVEQHTYDTTASHGDVACAACHGEDGQVDLSTQQAEVDTCAPCHSLREPISSSWSPGEPFLDHFSPVLLDSGMWTPDGGLAHGQEVFEWGSFVQSRMFEAGVRCSDCHDPHSGKLQAEGNALCTQCHDSPTFDTPTHHGHQPETTAAQCTSCHMPTTLFMGIDARHDHHIRVPDPAASSAVGGTSACEGCHGTEVLGLAGDTKAGDFGEIIEAAHRTDARAAGALRSAVADRSLGAMRRASALRLLTAYPPSGTELEVGAALSDPEALVRAAAASTSGAWGLHTDAVEALLRDPVALVRLSAATGLAGRPVQDRSAYAAVVAEAEEALPAAADIPSAHNNLGVLRASSSDTQGAVSAFSTALQLDSNFPAAQQNLALMQALATTEKPKPNPGGEGHQPPGE